ncbi:NPCBM/NEW2 domain-containing protein [Leifsonia shinshuensis]|uniref:NPCBM/NEW2 domain-containing protein n=1 Tax=Leifsonia shinshuensis TaxID=150026 RepID=UPI0028577269|nr:NPCBM/NEW2 domain-containing protein [Leifsonia shinshuensis]MDR6972919.1 alpha-galactosidase [Leifsonia shinshuensis]
MFTKRLLGLGAAALLGLTGVTASALPASAASEAVTTATTSDTPTAPVLGATPYAGWNTYFGLGGDYTEAQVLDVADHLVSSGLAKVGYDIVWLDGGWQSSTPRGAGGQLQGDPTRFPQGMAALAAAIHAKGLKAGIYTDAGPYIPGSCGLGSYGHYQTDADTFASWGYDAVKVDFLCGIAANLDPKTVYTQFADALRHNSSGRPMILNICNPVTSPDWGNYPDSQQSTNTWSYAPAIAQSWRTYTDVGFVNSIRYADVLRNFDANARHPEVAGPGHFNDPDYLGPQLGMTDEEFRSQMALWSISAAPLVVGSDPRTFTPTTVATLTNPDLLAIDRDALGKQAVRVGPAGNAEVWAKPLADGSTAVALVNRGDSATEISTTPAAVGVKAARVTVKDAWTHAFSEAKDAIRADVPSHGVGVLIVSKGTGQPESPRVLVSAPIVTAVNGASVTPSANLLAAAGSKLSVQVGVRNDGITPATIGSISLVAPEGWTAAADANQPQQLAPGQTGRVTFAVTVAPNAADGDFSVGASVQFSSLRGAVTVTSPSSTVTVAPAPPSGSNQPLSHQPWISATSGWMTPAVDQSVGGGNPIRLAGTTYATGLGVASPSDIRYYVGGVCTRLTGAVGIDDVVNNVGPEGGTATFSLVADGKTVWESGTVSRGTAVPFDVDLTGARELVLHVGDAGDGGYNDRADWAAPLISCS